MKKPLEGKVAVVAGSARGGGRGIACMLGAAGATVYCTARSRVKLEETAAMVSAHGGTGIAIPVDHTKPAEVEKLFARIAKEHGRVDVLVNNINADTLYQTTRSLDVPLETGLEILKTAIWSHIVNVHYAARLMKRGLIVEITDGDGFYYRGLLYYDLTKTNAIRLAMDFAVELRKKNIAVVAITPGFLRSEVVLASLHVTEENWRDAVPKRPEFGESETLFFVGCAIAALAADRNVMAKSGHVFNATELAREYGFTDIDGRLPDVWTWLANSSFHYRKIDDEFYSYFKIDWGALAREVETVQREVKSIRKKK